MKKNPDYKCCFCFCIFLKSNIFFNNSLNVLYFLYLPIRILVRGKGPRLDFILCIKYPLIKKCI